MKRIGFMFLLGLALITPLNRAAAQLSSVPARVQTDRLTVHHAPEREATVVGELPRDSIFIIEGRENILGNGGIWVFGSSNGLIGWVNAGYLRLPSTIKINHLPIVDVTTAAITRSSGSLLPIGRTWNDVNLRNGPGLTYAIVAVVPVHTDLSLMGRTADGTWVHASTGDLQGWLFAELLEIPLGIEALPVVSADQTTPEVVGSSAVTITDVNLRAAAGLSAEIVGLLPPRTPLTILEADGDWIRVQAGGQEGWVFRALIQTSDFTTPEPPNGTHPTAVAPAGGFYNFPMGVKPGGISEDNDDDGRINPYMYLATGIIYCIDNNGYVDTGTYVGGGILVYLYYAPVQGVIFFSPESEILAVGVPSQPTLIRAEGGFAFYRLPNGNFQMNGPNTDGSIFSFEWYGCLPNPVTQ